MDENHHLAKVRVAASNPVFRSEREVFGRERRATRPATNRHAAPDRPAATDRDGRRQGHAGAGAHPTREAGTRGRAEEGRRGFWGALRAFVLSPNGTYVGDRTRNTDPTHGQITTSISLARPKANAGGVQ